MKEFDTQKKVFEQLTVASTVLDDPQTALQEIDRVLHAAIRHKRPVYIELPRDMVTVQGTTTHRPAPYREKSDRPALIEALTESEKMINRAKQPVILADVEVHRFDLQEELKQFIEKTQIPFAATILGKSVLGEQHPLYLGVYEGSMGRDDVRRYIEESDCLIMLGAFMTDINLGIYTARLDPARSINATSEKISIRYHSFDEVRFRDYVHGLLGCDIQPRQNGKLPAPEFISKFKPKSGKPVTVKRLFQCLNSFVQPNTVVTADIGNALFGSAELVLHQRTEYLSPAYYASMGFAVPAAIGIEFSDTELRPLVLVGDGAFQMTGMELGSVVRYKLAPVVVVLNNRGYGIERHLHDGPFNDIPYWNYSKIPDILGAGNGFYIETEEQLVESLKTAYADDSQYSILDVQLDPMDRSAALERLAERLSKRI